MQIYSKGDIYLTLKAFYQKIGSNYDDVLKRLLSEKRIISFVIRFLEDDSFDKLCQSLDKMDYNAAFNYAHNLKGLAKNLGFDNLAKSAGNISDILRSENKDILKMSHTLINDVIFDYEEVKSAIIELKKKMDI